MKKIYRLSTTEPGLAKGSFFARGLPPPSTVEYRDHADRFTHADGSQAEHGYKSVEFSWDALTTTQANIINRLIVQAGSGFMYATIDRQDGANASVGWVDVRGWPHPLTTERVGGEVGSGSAIRVVFRIDNLTIVNNPSVYI